MWACTSGNTDTVTLLLAHGAVVDHRDKVKDLEHVHTHTLTDCSMWSYQDDVVSALMAASMAGSTETVNVLLQHGASLNLADVRTYITSVYHFMYLKVAFFSGY